jgi:2'-5' RNA ligase
MAYAVSLLFNAGVADVISGHWRKLADAEISSSMLDVGFSPHVTLTVYDTLRADVATAALDRVFESVDQMAVTLTGVTTFGAGSGVLYAALSPSRDLMRLQAIVAAAVDEACRPHYKAGGWTPHCTLATGLDDTNLDRAKTVLEGDWRLLTGVFEAAALVEFTPVTSVKRWTLARPARPTRMP